MLLLFPLHQKGGFCFTLTTNLRPGFTLLIIQALEIAAIVLYRGLLLVMDTLSGGLADNHSQVKWMNLHPVLTI
jgi:hypothetical protein